MTDALTDPVVAEKDSDRTTEAFNSIRQLILFDRLPPGTPIIQTKMARKLHHSRATLRAALQRLAQEGYVVETELGTYSRFVVASLTVEDMNELYSIIGALEGMAVRYCAELDTDRRLALADRLEALTKRNLEMGQDEQVPRECATRVDTELHNAFAGMAPGSRLKNMLDSVRPQADRYRDVYSVRRVPEMRALAAPEHQEIVDAIRSGDADRSERAVGRHWRACAERMRALIERLGERRGYLEY